MDVEVSPFIKVVLEANATRTLFNDLSTCVEFEPLGKGRWGTVLVKCGNDGSVPIARCTTSLDRPAQRFRREFHDVLVEKISQAAGIPLEFNNASAEIYDSQYRKMGLHTDSSVDLTEDSWICLFSVYEDPAAGPRSLRTLSTVNKASQQHVDITLDHGSAVIFSTKTNAAHLHKIVSSSRVAVRDEPRWLGLTFRLSKRYVHFADGIPHLGSREGPILTLATPEERHRFLDLKGRENKRHGQYLWDEDISFTISKSDLMEPA